MWGQVVCQGLHGSDAENGLILQQSALLRTCLTHAYCVLMLGKGEGRSEDRHAGPQGEGEASEGFGASHPFVWEVRKERCTGGRMSVSRPQGVVPAQECWVMAVCSCDASRVSALLRFSESASR